jgi:hypothetical protein
MVASFTLIKKKLFTLLHIKEQKMTRKHFIAMAKEISQMPNMAHRLASAIAFCKVAQTTNPRFDQARFLDACKV